MRSALLFLLGASVGLAEEPHPSARFVASPDLRLAPPPDGPSFRGPLGVSTDPFGNVFVADTGNHRVIRYDEKGRFVFQFGGYGWSQGELSGPTDVCAREGFRLFVVDAGNERIQVFDIGDSSPEGTAFPFGEGRGLSGEELVRPVRMDADREGRIYVSDELCHCVWIFSATGGLVTQLGGLGEAPSRFRDPAGVAVGPRGSVYVADAGNGRVQVFDSIGNWKAAWTGPADDPLQEPTGIDVSPDGNVYVADAAAARIRVFTPAGVALFSFGGPGEDEARFHAPVDVEVGPDGRAWVVDEVRQTVQAFRIVRAVAGER
ncbi:MAG TPA: NHL repeat-containing protein [bacterium]|nr:NHL repeat-containing protein [bacterium]